MTPKKRYSFWINDAEADGLKAVKAAQGISESEQIRQAVRDWLEKKGVKKADRKRAPTRKRP
jgi:Ribbon-helix-helix protein, copG family